jgi:hypothetical protein
MTGEYNIIIKVIMAQHPEYLEGQIVIIWVENMPSL